MPTILSRKPGGSGGGSSTPSGPAGGDLSGTYPNPTIPTLDPVEELFGTPTTAFEFDTSSLVGLTALSPTPDVENADTSVPGCYFLRDNGTTSCCGRYIASPATPFTSIAKHYDTLTAGNSEPIAGVFVGQATPGVIHCSGHHYSNGSSAFFASWLRFTNPTTFNTGATLNINASSGIWYSAIVANSNTDIDILVSVNGYTWAGVSIGLNPLITIGSTGIMLNAGNVVNSAAFDYLRVWNSALSFPGVVT